VDKVYQGATSCGDTEQPHYKRQPKREKVFDTGKKNTLALKL